MMQSRAPMNVERALSGQAQKAYPNQATSLKPHRTSATKFGSASARAVRPASLAASARPQRFDPSSGSGTQPALSREAQRTKTSIPSKARAALCKVTAHSKQMQALRRSAKPNTTGRAGTSCCAARAGGFGLLAGSATQRTMLAGCVPQSALPNPSIERTSPGKPGAASHLKR